MNLRRALFLSALVLLAALLRFWRIDAQSLWFDEGIAWHAATQPDLAAAIAADPTNPPLYFLLLYAGVRLGSDTEFTMRWLSVMIGLLAVPLTWQLARRLFTPVAGALAALLVACSPPLWWASQEIRMYGLMVVLTLVAALAWHRLIERESRQAWLGLWVAELGLLYSHSTGPIFALWLNAVTLPAWLFRRRPRWQTWLAGQIVVGLLWSPWLVARFVLLPAANQTVISPPALTPELLGQIWQLVWAGAWSMVGQSAELTAGSAIAFVIALIILDWRKRATGWLALHALLIVAGVLAGLAFVGINLHGRYLVAAVPFVLVALAGGLAHQATQTDNPARRRVARVITGGALLVFVAQSALGIGLAAFNPAYQHDDVRGMVRYYADTLTADDTVIARSYVDRYELAYYWPRLGAQARLLALAETAEWNDVAGRLPQSGKVAENFWFAQRGDYRRMLSCMLGHGGVRAPAYFETFGLGNNLHDQAPAQLPITRPLSGHFQPAQITAIGTPPAFTAERAACLPVEIVLDQRTIMPLKVALIARNDLGWEIVRADAVFARADQRASDAANPGDALAAYPLLRLPYGAPPGVYPLIIRLYDESNMSGYDVLGPTGAPAGKDLEIGAWIAQPGADWSSAAPPAHDAAHTPIVITAQQTLLRHDADAPRATPLRNGDRIRLALLWQSEAPLPPLTLSDAAAGWRVDVPARVNGTGVILDWREARIPASAPDGTAELRLPDGRVLARYPIAALPVEFVEPAYATPVSATLPGIGSLIGYTLAGDPQTIDRSAPLSITLVWQAHATPDTSYTVFVQVLDAQGRLIAQSDALPAQGARPTTGWRPGEYIIDTHALAFKPGAAPGPARMIAGMYNAVTGQRAPLDNDSGDAAISLPTPLTLK